jgi:hypothetical protein
MDRYVVRETTWGYDLIDTWRSQPGQPYYIARGLGQIAAMLECMQLNGKIAPAD